MNFEGRKMISFAPLPMGWCVVSQSAENVDGKLVYTIHHTPAVGVFTLEDDETNEIQCVFGIAMTDGEVTPVDCVIGDLVLDVHIHHLTFTQFRSKVE